jgi:hypothetical protein
MQYNPNIADNDSRALRIVVMTVLSGNKGGLLRVQYQLQVIRGEDQISGLKFGNQLIS